MNNIEKQHPIKRENLNEEHYFQSILQEAYRQKLLSDFKLSDIQLQSIQLLTLQTESFTGGESSSVRVETAQSLLQSTFYTIGIYLKSFSDTTKSLEVLQKGPLQDLYEHGKELIDQQIESAKQLLYSVRENSILTDNQAYNDTLQNGLPPFFSAYNAHFAAHDTPASIDYPLCADKMNLVGIEYILSYLQKLFLENQFCNSFAAHDINCLLRGYDEHYQDLLINIFELVLTNALGTVLSKKNAISLDIKPSDIQYLKQNLASDDLDALLQDASWQLFAELDIKDKTLQEYILGNIHDISVKLKKALDNGQLESIFISLKEPLIKPILQFEDGKKMDDEAFRSLADEIRECRFVRDKIAIIKKEIHSIVDLVDILEGYTIFDGEFAEVFKSLGDTELALLFKRLPTSSEEIDLHFTENEKDWQIWLNRFFEEIDSKRAKKIKELAEKIQSD